MKAIVHRQTTPLSDENALELIDAPEPELLEHDVLVDVKAVAVNPVDVKVRANMAPDGDYRILGYDAAGVVLKTGSRVSHFKPGDEVYYAGDITRAGSNAERQVVDERIVGHKPKSLNFLDAASLPLTTITAWEILQDCFGLTLQPTASHDDSHHQGQESLLIIGAAGGVGSILIQLAKQLTNLQVIATASRPETADWVRQMGADRVIDHHQPLNEALSQQGSVQPRYVAALTQTQQHFTAIEKLIQPLGHIAMIDDPGQLDISLLKTKALTLSWEFMFARSMYQTKDMIVQQQLLNQLAGYVDEGLIKPTTNYKAGQLTVDNLLSAHELQESAKAIGKTVLTGF